MRTALLVLHQARHRATLPSKKRTPTPAMICLPTREPGWCARDWFSAYSPVAPNAPVPITRHERQSAGGTRRGGEDGGAFTSVMAMIMLLQCGWLARLVVGVCLCFVFWCCCIRSLTLIFCRAKKNKQKETVLATAQFSTPPRQGSVRQLHLRLYP